ncbi:MAG: CinA family nicotinamide mononucleotide deamidase-related protein, partial [Chloroflexi bacterium]
MRAEIVMIGTELLLGEIVDTNAVKLARALRRIGVDLHYKTTVGDNEARITEVLNIALDRADVVITSGGLGPTVDDVTRQAVANATGRRLVYSPELEAQIAERFRKFGRTMAENNKRQAFIPEGATPLPNPVGTAPCFLSEDVRGRGFVISLPGVPRELEYMLEHTVIPLLVARMGGVQVIKTRILRTCAVGESDVDRAIADLMTASNPTVGLAAHPGQTDVRITAKAPSEAEADALIAPVEAELRRRLGVAVYGVDEETVPEVVGRMLVERGLSLGIVDTLTDCGLSHALSDAGYRAVIAACIQADTPVDALSALGLDVPVDMPPAEAVTAAQAAAQAVAAENGLGLALLGPFGEERATVIALHGPGETRLVRTGRNYREADYARQWLVIQGLDWVRRSLLGQLESPVDGR